MKKILVFAIPMLCILATGWSQTADKPYTMFQNQMMKPRVGQEDKFEKAVMAHIAKYHAADPYKAKLSRIDVGMGSDGWYVFSLGPCMYSQLDAQPQGTSQAHDDDWSNTISPLIASYGETTNWKLNDEISYTPSGYAPEKLDVWQIKIKPGQRYKFEELTKKISKVWKDKNYTWSFRVFSNDLWSSSGYNAAIIYGFNKWADMDLDVKYKADYEAVYGEGSWTNFWDDWRDAVESVDENIRVFVK